MIGADKMRFAIADLPKSVAVIEKYPELAEYKELSDKEHDQILRIAMFATDENSPFVKLEREDYEKRLQKIFEYYQLDDPKLLSEFSLGTNLVYENMVNRFFMLCDNMAYVMWADKLRMFHYIGISLRQPPSMNNIEADMTKKANLDKKRTEIYNDLIEYEAQVFSDVPTRNKIRKQLAKLLQPAEEFAQPKGVV